MDKKFIKGEKVVVTKEYMNAFDFTIHPSRDIRGVYSLIDWRDVVFEIMGNYKPVSFEHNKNIYGAYPLGVNGKTIGYVYNTAIKKATE